jgi:hypothetical protein
MNCVTNHRPVDARLVAPLALALAIGCSASTGTSPAQVVGADAGTDAGEDAGVAGDTGTGGVGTDASDAPLPKPEASADAVACMLTTLPILVDAVQDTFNVPVTDNGEPSAFLIDTGAPTTYVWLPLPDGGMETPNAADAGEAGIAAADASCAVEQGCVADAGSVTLGCETLELPGFPQAPLEPVGGLSVVGTIGDDRLLAAPTWIDLAGKQVVFHAPGDPFTQAAGWPATGMTRPYGYVRVEDVLFDGQPVKLLLDTGASDVLWLGQQPAPGDQEIMGVDAIGQPVIMYVGQVTVSIGVWSKTVQVLKVPSFPYFQPLATAAGVQGLFGVSAFPDGVVFDTDAMKVRVAP